MRNLQIIIVFAMLIVASAGAAPAQVAGVAAPEGASIDPQRLVRPEAQVRAEDDRNGRADAEVTDVASFVRWAQAARRERVAALYKRREALRTERGNSRLKREQIEGTNAEIVRINTPTEPYVPRVTANKVITLAEQSPTRYLRVLEVVDPQIARVRLLETFVGGKDLEFFLVGTDTAGWVDGGKPPLDGVLIGDGSRSYRTAEGTNRTIAVMKHYAIPMEELTRRDEVRTWRDEGGSTHSGALVLYEAGRVTIMDMNGQATNLKWTDLSAGDREYVAKFAPTPAVRKRAAAVSK
jgi:hypothetical protein